ncbi:UNVERIFIED_CONTAM: GerAB/ArcD/ProY family transporter [Halobacillus marinus]|uniref:GerAB/ArcD/ProY family transporter n=1 Tax=Bacillaceae TaxID=186817 RepID=UPI0002A52224|nr:MULTISPECIES: GerAB/ArcD/ProY family transporter [Bacillaceae]ELK47590.1 spore germination protein [Halobacillus sp. BAB-2008]QHT45906.1 GerAB/ArcD/ProY family transporter [Bacillus sp. SB49]
MNINIRLNPDKAVHAFYVFFIIHTCQIGAGLMGVPRILFLEAGVDAWVSVLVTGAYMHVLVLLMLTILRNYENTDLIGVQVDLFGPWIGKGLGVLYILYIFLLLLTVMKNYIEVVQVFIFPQIPIWLMSAFMLILMVYSILGGFRVVVGTSFLFFFLTIWLVLPVYKPVTFMDWKHLTPIFMSSPMEILAGAKQVAYSVLGLEILFFIYPYIQNKKKIAVAAHAGVFFTTILILLVTVVSIGYFSPDELKETVWATLSLFKIISFSIIERFDFLAVALWMMVIIPNVVLFGWIIIHSLKRLFSFPKKPSLYITALMLFFSSILIEERIGINYLTSITGEVGFWVVFIYPWILYVGLLLKKLFRKGKSNEKMGHS